MDIGEKGLALANLTIPQKCSLSFEVKHTDEAGNPVDHTASELHMALQRKDGSLSIDLDSCCTGTATGVSVFVPATVTANMPLGKMLWDLIAEMQDGNTIRLVYGDAAIVDTYALDGEDSGS